MITGVDHVVYVVLDLDDAVSAYRHRGFTVTPGGEHSGGMTHNALIGFSDGSYLELIAFRDIHAARGKHSWQPVAERGGGWADFALLSDDINADADALKELLVRPVERGGRTRPDGIAVAWVVARLRSPLPFLIEDVTLRAVRVPIGDAARHKNNTRRIANVILGARDAETVTRDYSRLRERGAPRIDIKQSDRDGLRDVVFE